MYRRLVLFCIGDWYFFVLEVGTFCNGGWCFFVLEVGTFLHWRLVFFVLGFSSYEIFQDSDCSGRFNCICIGDLYLFVLGVRTYLY